MLKDALAGDDIAVTAGPVLQELLQGLAGAKAGKPIVERFSALAWMTNREHLTVVGRALLWSMHHAQLPQSPSHPTRFPADVPAFGGHAAERRRWVT